ncbi:MAG: hypothetical protein HUK09_08050, partial [Bacteroidaceae bacterium]|nr:hypothetical protein [Bacteroidaceae bacterium]
MRDTTFSILKGLALLFVVMASALPPIYLQQTAQLLGFPALFVAAGYLIKPEVLQAKTAFVVGRIKRIYFPFVFFGLLFLLLHNVFFSWGLLSTQMSAV